MNTFELSVSEQQCLEALRQGDESAFNSIYNTHFVKLYSIAYNSTKCTDLAQEIVQEIFVSFWINRKTLLITKSIEAYLIGAVRNKVFDHLDKQIVRDRHKQRVMEVSNDSNNSTEETVDFEDLSTAVNKEIEALPDTTRGVFVLSRFNGTKNSEIAKQYSISVKAVEYHLTKALKHLRLHLKHLYISR
jgi:RNA polymerase sigma-70 factor (family 1)